MLISITEAGEKGKKNKGRENNTERPRPRHRDPYENKIQPKWICCNWFQIVRSGERRYRQLLCETDWETRMFTQAFLSYINRHAEITREGEKERVRRSWQKKEEWGNRERTAPLSLTCRTVVQYTTRQQAAPVTMHLCKEHAKILNK